LVLHDALGFRTHEVAEMLGTSRAAAKSALQRARAALARSSRSRERTAAPSSAGERRMVARFAEAFLAADLDGLLALLTDDAMLTMPPAPHEYRGRDAIAAFQRASFAWRGNRNVHLLPTRANTQPAFGAYLEEDGSGVARPAGLIVLTIRGDRIAAITRFHYDGLHLLFGLPAELPAGPPPEPTAADSI